VDREKAVKMETVRREESTEVLNPNPADGATAYVEPRLQAVSAPVVVGNTDGSTGVTTQQTVTSTGDPYAVRRDLPLRVQNGLYLLFGVLEGLLAIRFVLRLLGANPAAGFAQFIYGVTAPFIAPFVGLFGQPRFEGNVFEFNSLVAILIYALIAWVLVKMVWLALGNSRRGVRTTASQVNTHNR
jgi:YggT family protein